MLDWLSSWVCLSKGARPHLPTRILVVSAATGNKNKKKSLYQDLVLHILSSLRVSEPNRPYTLKEAEQLVSKVFEDVKLLVLSNKQSSTEDFQAQLEDGLKRYKTSGYCFNALHLDDLLQEAFQHLSRDPMSHFSVYKASRRSNQVPNDLEQHLERVVRLTQGKIRDVSRLIASSLLIEAYPDGMHGTFSPSR